MPSCCFDNKLLSRGISSAFEAAPLLLSLIYFRYTSSCLELERADRDKKRVLNVLQYSTYICYAAYKNCNKNLSLLFLESFVQHICLKGLLVYKDPSLL